MEFLLVWELLEGWAMSYVCLLSIMFWNKNTWMNSSIVLTERQWLWLRDSQARHERSAFQQLDSEPFDQGRSKLAMMQQKTKPSARIAHRWRACVLTSHEGHRCNLGDCKMPHGSRSKQSIFKLYNMAPPLIWSWLTLQVEENMLCFGSS
jgi:hypothetical protein